MNNIRRKRIESLMEKLEDLKSDLDLIMADEQEARDNIPENMQESERYQRAEEACDNLEYAYGGLEEVIDYLTEAAS